MGRARFSIEAGQKIWEATQQVLRDPLNLSGGRGRATGPGQFRLATVIEVGSGTATDTGCGTVVVHKIRLITATFDEVLDGQSLECTELQERDFFAATLPGRTVELDETVQVEWWNNRYWILGGGGGGSVSIYFQILTVECLPGGEKYLNVQVERVAPHCSTVPEVDAYGRVDVFDDGFRCILDEYTQEELEGDPDILTDGLRGKATYSSVYPTDDYEGCTGNWTLDGLCNPPGCVS